MSIKTTICGTFAQECRYGENAWQKPAALYAADSDDPLALPRFEKVGGSSPSYNNWCDIDRLLQTLTHAIAAYETNEVNAQYCALGAKHGNVCGAAFAGARSGVLRQMLIGDPLAIFGGVVMTNFPIDTEEATILREHATSTPRILDAVVAPAMTESAVQILTRKGDRCQMLVNPALASLTSASLDAAPRYRYVRGGFLKQPNYTFVPELDADYIEHVGRPLTHYEKADLLLAWAIGSTSNSNTVTLVKHGYLIGNGVGQQDRVGAAQLALVRAKRSGHTIGGSSAYSDSFFPFTDGPEALLDAGVTSVLTSYGSRRDEDVRSLFSARGAALLWYPDAIGRGFFGH